MEWLWVLALLAVLFGPIVWVFARERRSTGAPSREDQLNQTGIAGELRNSATAGHGPGTNLPPGPDP
jgi:cytochrome c-type biogenesis protein CcmH/NrfF